MVEDQRLFISERELIQHFEADLISGKAYLYYRILMQPELPESWLVLRRSFSIEKKTFSRAKVWLQSRGFLGDVPYDPTPYCEGLVFAQGSEPGLLLSKQDLQLHHGKGLLRNRAFIYYWLRMQRELPATWSGVIRQTSIHPDSFFDSKRWLAANGWIGDKPRDLQNHNFGENR